MIYRLFQINKELLNRELNLISQEAYITDMNTRFKNESPKIHSEVYDKEKPPVLEPGDEICNIDEIQGIDKSNAITLINIGMEMFLSKESPIQLQKIDSVASGLFRKDGINSALYSRIIDTEHSKILASTLKGRHSSSLLIKSKNIPLNFQKTKVLQILLLNPMRDIFSQMAGILFLSLLLSLFCIYC